MSTLGAWEIPGDAGAVLAVADRLGTIAVNTAEIARQVEAGKLAGNWSGPSADAFALLVENLPKDIKKIADAHDTASSALSKFGHDLQWMKTQAGQLASQLDGARAEAAAAAARQKAAKKAALGAQMQHTKTTLDPAAHHVAGQQLAKANHDLADASSAKERTSGSVGSLEAQAKALHDTFVAAAKQATQSVNDACTLSLGDRWGAGYARYVEGTVLDTALQAIVAPFRALWELPGAILKFAGDPSWTNARAIIDGVGAIVTIVALAVALVGAPFALVMAGVVIGVAAVKVGVTAAAVATEDLDSKELAYDAAGLGLSFVPFAKIKVKMGNARSPGAATHYKNYGVSYNPQPVGKVLKNFAGDRVDDAIGDVLVDLEWRGAELLFGPVKQAPTIFTPASKPGAPPVLCTPNVTVRHYVPLDARPAALAAA